ASLLVDEVYRGIQFAGELSPAAADLGSHAISIGDVAKPYGLGGLRVGWIATANRAILRRCAELRDYTSICGSVPGEFLAALALEHRETILARHLATARANRALFSAAMEGQACLQWQHADGGFTIFPRVMVPGSSGAWCRELNARYGVLLLPG